MCCFGVAGDGADNSDDGIISGGHDSVDICVMQVVMLLLVVVVVMVMMVVVWCGGGGHDSVGVNRGGDIAAVGGGGVVMGAGHLEQENIVERIEALELDRPVVQYWLQ